MKDVSGPNSLLNDIKGALVENKLAMNGLNSDSLTLALVADNQSHVVKASLSLIFLVFTPMLLCLF